MVQGQGKIESSLPFLLRVKSVWYCVSPHSNLHERRCIVGESYWLEVRLVLAVKCFLAVSCLRLPGNGKHFSQEQRKSTGIIS